jgi:PAS domain S-box-containing protein
VRPRFRYLLGLTLIAAAHYAAAELGLALAFAGNASVIWLPAGVSIGALAAFGLRYWPAVLLAELIATGTSSLPLDVALGETAGNTGAALVGAAILRAAFQRRTPFTRLRDVVALAGLAAPVSSLVSATIGVSSLVLGGVLPSDGYADVWQRWLLADMAGALVVAPAVVVLATYRPGNLGGRYPEALVLAAALAAAVPLSLVWEHGRPYFLLPVLLWAAIRFLQPGAVLASLLASGAAIALTAQDVGFFVQGDLDKNLLYAQLFMSVGTLMSLVLGIVTAEREAGRRRHVATSGRQRAVAELGQRALEVPELEELVDEAARVVAATLEIEPAEIRRLLSAAASDHPYDVLDHGTSLRDLGEDDASFLQSVANILASAFRRAEQDRELRDGQHRLALALEVGQMGVWDWDIVAGDVGWSTMLEDLRGYSSDRFDGVDSFLSVVHPDDRDVFRCNLAAAIESGEEYEHEIRVRTGGDYRWSHACGRVFRDEDGRAVRMLGVATDVTARKEAEEELRSAEQRYRTLVEQLPLVTYLDALGVESSSIYTSPQIQSLLGYSSEEWLEDRELFVRTLHPEDRDRVLAEHALAHATGAPLRTEYRLIARDGSVVWLQDEAVVVRDGDGEPLFLQGYLLDITERKAAEQALAERENLLQTIIATEPECVKLIGADGTLMQMNRAGLEMVEADSLEQILGGRVEDLVVPEHRDAFKALTRKALNGGSGSLEFELVGLRGTRRWLETHAVPLRETTGKVQAALSVTRDVTERRRLEQQLVQSQKMEAVGRLAGGIAHDFNNLLTGIIGYSDLLRMGLPAESPLRADADEVRKAAERAASLTRQLLAFSRRQVLQPRVIDLHRVVVDMDRMLRRLIGEDIELVASCAPGLGRVEADPGQLEQVIANLAVNARDAMPAGGRLVIEAKNAVVTTRAVAGGGAEMPPGDYVVLSVTDTGTGMDSETKAHLFEPFFTTKEVGKGTGLGLATVYGIVKQSNGFIWVDSEPGSGTSVRIYLPRVEKEAEPASEQPTVVYTAQGGSETVLVVEDEHVVRSLLSEDLARRGYTVLTADNGVEALALACAPESRIDVVVTDVIMPEMGGIELARELTAAHPGLRVIYMSGYSERTVAEGVGPWPLLQKPFNASALAATIREVLDVAPAA